MTKMRAKLRVTSVKENIYDGVKNNEQLSFCAVSKPDGYPDDGSDENNTYAKFSPSASLEITVANPALFGQFQQGEEYYVDFTPAATKQSEAAAA